MDSPSEINRIDGVKPISYVVRIVMRSASSHVIALNIALALGGVLTISGACGGEDTADDNALPSCQEDTRDEDYVAGISKTGEAGYTVAIVDSLPAPPAKGDNDWTLELRDGSDTLMPGLVLQANAFMPDHGHSSPLLAVMTDDGDGVYTLTPINLFMPGYWETTITVVDPGPD